MMSRKCMLSLLLLFLPRPAEGDVRTPNFRYFYPHYSTIPIKRNWLGTQIHCRHYGYDMISIRDAEDNRNFLDAYGWIGLYRDTKTSAWKWSRRDEVADFLAWEDGEPADGKNCAFKKRGELGWRSDYCGVGHTVMCNRELLVLVKENQTWEEALMHCRALEAKDPALPVTDHGNHRYDLATLITDDDHSFAREKARSATTGEVWTGLRHLGGSWLWVGGEEVRYQATEKCPVSRFCGTLPTGGSRSFEMRHCNERRNFFCYRKP